VDGEFCYIELVAQAPGLAVDGFGINQALSTPTEN
jgi:hypothetical protein